MRVEAGGDEADEAHRARVDQLHAARRRLAGSGLRRRTRARRGTFHVLRAAADVDVPRDRLGVQVDSHHLAGEFATGEREAAVGGEVHVVDAGQSHGQRFLERERVWVAERERLARFLDHDRVPSVGREVHVVRVGHRDVRAGALAGVRVDRCQAVADVVRGVQRAKVPAGTTCWTIAPVGK